MRLDREQQIAEGSEHVRPDRFALEAARKPAEQLLVDRHREVIAPELCQPLDERSLGGDGRAQARRHLAQVDRPQELRQCLRGGGGNVRARLAGGRRPLGRLALGANLLPQLLRLRQCLLRGA